MEVEWKSYGATVMVCDRDQRNGRVLGREWLWYARP